MGNSVPKDRLYRIHKFRGIDHVKIEVVFHCPPFQQLFVHFNAGNDLSLKILIFIVLNMAVVVAASAGDIPRNRGNQCNLMTGCTQLSQSIAVGRIFLIAGPGDVTREPGMW
jgi:hypothetical protein